jgi:hypothetical protein
VDDCVAVICQQLADLAELLCETTDANVLHHADGDHAIEAAGRLAMVKLDEFGLCAHPSRLRTLAQHFDLCGIIHVRCSRTQHIIGRAFPV